MLGASTKETGFFHKKNGDKQSPDMPSPIEWDLYFKAQTNNYLSFIMKEFIAGKEFRQGKLLSCICEDNVFMSFLNPYFKEALTVDLLEETGNWFKAAQAKFSFSKRSLNILKSFKIGYFDCVAIRLTHHQISSDNFKNVLEVFKRITKHLIVIEDYRSDKNDQSVSAYRKSIEYYFTCVSKIKLHKWNFMLYENDLL